MTQNEFSLLYAIKKHGMQSCRCLKEKTGLSVGYISQMINQFLDDGLIDRDGITDQGLEVLGPYKVDNAIIMAAGMSSRFVPISLEKPKGLLVVKGEVLIERQIRQLREAGIQNIVLVLGYKKESFFYLEDKFENLRIIINPKYDVKNNVFTIYLAQQYIANSYICSSDNYFTENPFEEYVYQSFYSAIEVNSRLNEWYMIPDTKMNISKIVKNDKKGYIMMGHVYWNRDFSREMINLINQDQGIGIYDSDLWEQILSDNLKKLPPMGIRVYPTDVIHEFDSLDDLRQFDRDYVSNTNSKIMKDIIAVLDCKEGDIHDFYIIKKGLTNTSVCFETGDRKYVYRYSENREGIIVNRKHEKKSIELAKSIGMDPTLLFMNEEKGWKLSLYIDGAHSPDYNNQADIKRVASTLRKLHDHQISVNWSFLPWEEIRNMELLLRSEKDGIADRGFDRIKDAVTKVYTACQEDSIEKCFCHCDPSPSNWLLTDDQTILIDWEYAGKADPGCDVGTFILNSGWEPEEAKSFIMEYYGVDVEDSFVFHHLAYTAIMAFYWYVWALYRESNGVVMGEGIYNWRSVAKKYSRFLIEQYGL